MAPHHEQPADPVTRADRCQRAEPAQGSRPAPVNLHPGPSLRAARGVVATAGAARSCSCGSRTTNVAVLFMTMVVGDERTQQPRSARIPSINWWSTRAPATATPWPGSSSTSRSGRWVIARASRRWSSPPDREVTGGSPSRFQAHGGKRGVDVGCREAAGQRHQSAQTQRQRVAHRQPLRNVADFQPLGSVGSPWASPALPPLPR